MRSQRQVDEKLVNDRPASPPPAPENIPEKLSGLPSWKRQQHSYKIRILRVDLGIGQRRKVRDQIAQVGTSDRIPIFQYSDSCRTKKALSEYRTNIAIGLQLSDQLHWTSDSPIAIGLTEMYRTTNWEFLFFLCVFLHEFSPFISRNWRLCCAVSIGLSDIGLE